MDARVIVYRDTHTHSRARPHSCEMLLVIGLGNKQCRLEKLNQINTLREIMKYVLTSSAYDYLFLKPIVSNSPLHTSHHRCASCSSVAGYYNVVVACVDEICENTNFWVVTASVGQRAAWESTAMS